MNKTEESESFSLPVSLRIQAPLSKVFGAWIRPEVAAEWLCDQLEGSWTPGNSVYWHFGDQRQELRIISVVAEKSLRFLWNANGDRAETEVEITFEAVGNETWLRLNERSWLLSAENVKIALDQACGWENLFCRLKAWTESRTRLR
jgi:uncharacterized protein YndB with AHSA1/START domain